MSKLLCYLVASKYSLFKRAFPRMALYQMFSTSVWLDTACNQTLVTGKFSFGWYFGLKGKGKNIRHVTCRILHILCFRLKYIVTVSSRISGIRVGSSLIIVIPTYPMDMVYSYDFTREIKFWFISNFSFL